jgi:hypothetical protein
LKSVYESWEIRCKRVGKDSRNHSARLIVYALEVKAMKHKTFLVFLLALSLIISTTAPAGASTNSSNIRIRFETGATSAVAFGKLAPKQAQDYVLRAMAGQIMQVTLWPDTNAWLSVWGADGTQLKAPGGEVGWQGKLPKTQDYFIRVSAPGHKMSYCLRVTVFARIQLARGATSATRSSPQQQCFPQGVEVVGGYALRALAGQTMRVSINSPGHNTYLTITGANGSALKYYDDWNTSWEGVLPATQDYYLLPVAVGKDARFTINLSISPLSPPTATRIRFAPGAESAQISVQLAFGASARYVLWAAKGQRMEVNIWPVSGNPPVGIDLAVSAPNGQAWQLGEGGVIDPLPVSGDYFITLTQPGGSSKRATLQVRIPAN